MTAALDRRRQAVAFFIGRGWPLEQASGIVANLEAESGLRPDAVGDGGAAYGVAQWHADRQSNFAGVIGKPIRDSSLEEQLYFVHAELQGTEKRAGDALALCKTAAEAASVVCRLYERPADIEGDSKRRAALAQVIFQTYGGASGAATTPPVADTPPDVPATPQPTEQAMPALALLQAMPALALLQLFGPILAGMIPQIKPLLAPGTDKTQKFAGIAQVVLDTINQAAGAPNLQASIEAMQADPKVKQAVQQAVVSHPEIIDSMTITEVGGGVTAARESDLKAQLAEAPFWKASAVFWVSVLLLPIVYWLVGSLIVGGMVIPGDWPWYAQMPLKLFGGVWNGESRSGGFNLVIGLILGGICGVYYGVSVTQAKQQQAQQVQSDSAK